MINYHHHTNICFTTMKKLHMQMNTKQNKWNHMETWSRLPPEMKYTVNVSAPPWQETVINTEGFKTYYIHSGMHNPANVKLFFFQYEIEEIFYQYHLSSLFCISSVINLKVWKNVYS